MQGSLMISLEESEVGFHHSNCENCNVKVSQQKEEKKDKMDPYYLKS